MIFPGAIETRAAVCEARSDVRNAGGGGVTGSPGAPTSGMPVVAA